ncbi:MAG: DNA repair protein RecN [Deltaproteobacteria bacterium]|jgi:DNA repair protein RecN (Recombination protein N)|nr:DNA repair protein RecN [Deltaproteobacteria bacterium]
MLAELQVTNLALIEQLTLSFGPGANILTGETGAGKSILASSLSLIRGGKASADLVRGGARELRVEALFSLEKPEDFYPLFASQGLTPANEIILKRIVLPNGRSRAYLNGSLITINQLAQWGEELLAISSQHDQQSLLDPLRQRDFLDAYGGHKELLGRMAESHKEREKIKDKLNALREEARNGLEKRDFYEYLIKEIMAISPQRGEDLLLLEEKRKSKENTRLAGLLEECMGLFFGEEGALNKLDKLKSLLDKASNIEPSLNPTLESVRDISLQLLDSSRDIKNLSVSLKKVKDLEEVDERLSQLARLKRKYGPSLDDVLERYEEMKRTLNRLDNLSLDEQSLMKSLAKAEEICSACATELHLARKKSALSLSEGLMDTLKLLGFPKVELTIEVKELQPDKPMGEVASAKGADSVIFLFCPNPGEGLLPLNRIASGGELSRVMLALKTAQEPHSDQSLVFDEIDSGLSGAIAEAVAAKMAELSRNQQIFVITHQPYMAALDGRHFLAYKAPEGGRTLTYISELKHEERLNELARMLGGASPSPQALALSKAYLESGKGIQPFESPTKIKNDGR